ncbi:MAG: tetratricopeptide repeat protein [Pseudomonadota bacterium]
MRSILTSFGRQPSAASILAKVSVSAACLALAAGSASAQPITSRPVVQPLPPQDTQRLNRALVELAKRPRSVPALIEAGNAALAVTDLDAAIGFYKRVTEIEPENEAATLGLARVYMRSGRPVRALLYFDAAKSRGAGPLAIGSDFALTLDMLGDQASAQTTYITQIEASPKDDEARRRMALSFAISGNASAFEATLRPLIDRRDFAAFRARAFGLAIMGEQERAAAIADAVMPRALAQKVTPYLEFMPRLTPAQQAAAANLGIFPRAADIGRDAPGVVAYMERTMGQQPTLAAAPVPQTEDRLAPSGTPLGESPSSPTAEVVAQAPDPAPAPSQAAQPATAPTNRIADAFDDMMASDGETKVSAGAGAVDIASIDVPREVAPEPAQPETPQNPSRVWVQLATGRDLEALGFDWRRFTRKAPDKLKSFTPHTVRWGQANRLLAGPLDSREAARDLINALKQKGLDSFRYTSPEGMEIQELAVR